MRRHYVSVEEFGAKYGASQDDSDRLIEFLMSRGLTVLSVHLARRAIRVTGTVAQVSQALNVEFNEYSIQVPRRRRSHEPPATESHIYRSIAGPVRLPAELAPLVDTVVGLANRRLGHHNNDVPPHTHKLTVPEIVQLYNLPRIDATGQTIGIFNDSALADYSPPDIAQYFSKMPAGYNVAPSALAGTLVEVDLTVDGKTYTNDPTPVINFEMGPDYGPYVEEAQDIQIAATVAQGATIAIYNTDDTEDGILTFLQTAILPEVGQPAPSVLSSSWAYDEVETKSDFNVYGTLSQWFSAAAARGITVCYAAGDAKSNVYENIEYEFGVQYPGSDPWVLSCGGTTIGNVKWGLPTTFDEVVWNSEADGTGASQGGASIYFPAPAYQRAAGITGARDSKGKFHPGRGVPDVAGEAYGIKGIVLAEESIYPGGGTSAVAPLYAGLVAMLNAAFRQPVGFLNPAIYSFQQIGGLGDRFQRFACRDVTVGVGPGSPSFTAKPGWDACTGWGSIDGANLLFCLGFNAFQLSFLMGRSSWGENEVSAAAAPGGLGVLGAPSPAAYPNSFWLVLEGAWPNLIGNGVPKLGGSFMELRGVTVRVGSPQYEIPSETETIQRIFFPCDVTFDVSSLGFESDGGVFPESGKMRQFSLTATGTVALGDQIFPLSASCDLTLVAGLNPRFANADPSRPNLFSASEDLRVFTVTPGINDEPIAGLNPSTAPALKVSSTSYSAGDEASWDTAAGFAYIQALLAYLNANYNDPSGPDPFAIFPDQSSGVSVLSRFEDKSVEIAFGESETKEVSSYNFAVARVRLRGRPYSATGSNVRVFFRLFTATDSETTYEPDSTYKSSNDAAGYPDSPDLGISPVMALSVTTLPFFATGNYEGNGDFGANVDYSGDSVNNAVLTVGSTFVADEGETWAYFGCYLNLFSPKNTITKLVGTGWNISSKRVPVGELTPSDDVCLVAQIAFDGAPITVGSSPQNCDKLAQRNISILPV